MSASAVVVPVPAYAALLSLSAVALSATQHGRAGDRAPPVPEDGLQREEAQRNSGGTSPLPLLLLAICLCLLELELELEMFLYLYLSCVSMVTKQVRLVCGSKTVATPTSKVRAFLINEDYQVLRVRFCARGSCAVRCGLLWL